MDEDHDHENDEQPSHLESTNIFNSLFLGERRPSFRDSASRWLILLIFAFFIVVILASFVLGLFPSSHRVLFSPSFFGLESPQIGAGQVPERHTADTCHKSSVNARPSPLAQCQFLVPSVSMCPQMDSRLVLKWTLPFCGVGKNGEALHH
jgi:hypothetical protein